MMMVNERVPEPGPVKQDTSFTLSTLSTRNLEDLSANFEIYSTGNRHHRCYHIEEIHRAEGHEKRTSSFL